MKKFLVFVVICIVTASLGLLTYNFLATTEQILLEDVVYYVNVGDTFMVKYDRVNPKDSTTVNISNKGFEDILSKSITEPGVFTANQSGKAVLEFESSLKGFGTMSIMVYVGDGSDVNPYYIKNAEDLVSLQTRKDGQDPSTTCYSLVNSIDMSSVENFTPLFSNYEEGFNGRFDFGGNTISNINIVSDGKNAGFFSKIGLKANVNDAKLSNVAINGSFDYAGALAGICEGKVKNARVSVVTITNRNADASYNGGLVGMLTGSVVNSEVYSSENQTSYISGGENSVNGGLIGKVESVSAIASVTRCDTIRCNVSGKVNGGLIGEAIGADVRDVYSRGGNISASVDNSVNGGLIANVAYAKGSLTQGTSILNGYAANYVKPESHQNVVMDSLIAQINDYTGTKDVAFANIIVGIYNFTDTAEASKLVNTNSDKIEDMRYIFVNSINKQEVSESSFVTKTNIQTSEDGVVTIKEVLVNEPFSKDAWIIENGEYPKLNLDGMSTSSNLIRKGSAIILSSTSINDLVSEINAKPNSVIILTNDIDGNNTTINSIPEFNGVLNGNGHTVKNVKVNGGSLIGNLNGNIQNITFENITISNGEIIGIVTSRNNGSIKDVNVINSRIDVPEENSKLGFIAGENRGTINSVKVRNTTAHYAQNLKNYVVLSSMIAGENYSNIETAVVYADCNVKFDSEVKSVVSFGGIAGSNSGNIKMSVVGFDALTNNQLMVDSSTDLFVVVGGVAGMNSSNIEDCYVAGKFKSNSFAGIASSSDIKNDSMAIRRCVVSENVRAEAVRLGGIANSISSGTVVDCAVMAQLVAVSNDSEVAGVANSITYSDTNNSNVDKCFISPSFLDFGGERKGTRYFETSTWDVRKGKGNRAILNNIILNKSGMGDAKSQNYDEADNNTLNKLFEFIMQAKKEKDIRKDDAECKRVDTFAQYGFDILSDNSVWIGENNKYPTLRAITNFVNSL